MVKNINPKIMARNSIQPQRIKEQMMLLDVKSLDCLWERAYRCPCYTNGAPRVDCKLCHGQGFVYKDSYELKIAMYSDNNKPIYVNDTNTIPLSTLATPQITSNGIEDGISVSDRITVLNWGTPQQYMLNITNDRFTNGVFIPYKVLDIMHAFVFNDDETDLVDIKDKVTIDDNSFLKVSDETLIGKTISLMLNVDKRFYVVGLNKELRYETFEKLEDKEYATGLGNEFLSYSQIVDGKIDPTKKQLFKMPNQLILRRENLYFPNYNIIENDNDTTNNLAINDVEADLLLG